MQRLDVLTNDCHRNEFDISDVSNESCLLLCSHIIMLTLIFVDQVFVVLELIFVKEFFHLRVLFKQHQLELSIKKKMQSVSLFRRCKSILNEVRISNKKALTDSTLRSQRIKLESVIDMKLLIDSYIFQRNNDETLDNSSE